LAPGAGRALTAMPRASILQSAFNAGEWSPRLFGRPDLNKYNNACALLQNCLLMPQGTAMGRSGFRYLGAALSQDAPGWLIGFVFSADEGHVLEFGEKRLRFWRADTTARAAAVAGAIQNGAFTDGIDFWSNASSGGSSLQHDSVNKRLSLVGAQGGTAAARQQVTGASANVEHVLHVAVPRGPVTLRIGTTAGGEDLLEDRRLGEGWHAVAFTPSSTAFYIEFRHKGLFTRQVDDVALLSNQEIVLDTPWTAAEAPALRWAQSADVLYLLHGDHPPHKLLRYGLTSWSLERVAWQDGPYLAENDSDISLTPSANSGTITLTASDSLFKQGHVNALWRITHGGQFVKEDLTAEDSFSTPVSVDGPFSKDRKLTFTVSGTFVATVILQRSGDGGATWNDDVLSFTSPGSAEWTEVADLGKTIYYRLGIKSGGYTSGTATVQLVSATGETEGRVRITGYSSPTVVTGEVEKILGGTSGVRRWREGSWSDERGWPALAVFYEQRLFLANSKSKPQTLWASRSGDFETFTPGTEDDDPFSFTIAKANEIRWMEEFRHLVIGTNGPEYAVSGGTEQALAASRPPIMDPQTNVGSAKIAPVTAESGILFVQREKRWLHAIEFADSFSFGAPNITYTSEHLTRHGLAQLAWAAQPYSTLWAVDGEGQLLGFTYQPAEEVVGWHRHEIGGGAVVEAIATAPSEGGLSSDLWVLLRREVGGVTRRSLERMEALFEEDVAQRDGFFVDSGLTYDGRRVASLTAGAVSGTAVAFTASDAVFTAGDVGSVLASGNGLATITAFLSATAVTARIDAEWPTTAALEAGSWEVRVDRLGGLDHLAGETVTLCADGGTHAPKTVAGDGTLLLDRFAGVVHAGYGYRRALAPMPIEGAAADGPAHGKVRRVTRALIRLYRTLGLKHGPSLEELSVEPFRQTADALDAPPPLFTGVRAISIDDRWERDGTVYLVQDDPLPWAVVSVTWQLSGHDKP